jgi:hypothetical protein
LSWQRLSVCHSTANLQCVSSGRENLIAAV